MGVRGEWIGLNLMIFHNKIESTLISICRLTVKTAMQHPDSRSTGPTSTVPAHTP